MLFLPNESNSLIQQWGRLLSNRFLYTTAYFNIFVFWPPDGASVVLTLSLLSLILSYNNRVDCFQTGFGTLQLISIF